MTPRFATPSIESAMIVSLVCCLLSCASAEGTRVRSDAGGSDSGVGSIDAAVVPTDSESCGSADFRAESARRPIDIVIWVDDGGSFDDSRRKVGNSIQMNLVDILEREGVDWKIALMSASTPIGEPLASDPRFVRVPGGYSAGGGGFIFFADPRYIEVYRPELRTDAFRVLLSATDCENQAGYEFPQFEENLVTNGMGLFTGGDDRNYGYHMIGNIGLRPIPEEPWPPTDRIAPRGAYGGDFTNCSRVQGGAIGTGGLRLGVGAPNYDDLFQAIAAASVTESRLPCSFDPPDEDDIDLRYVRFRYRPGGDETMEQEFHEVADASACADGGFYPTEEGRLELCPSTCEQISTDPAAEVRFTFECVPF
jgi:hypothetical protein